MVVAIFSKNGPWSVSIVDVTIGFGSSASVQCWEKVSFFFVDILTAVATTVIVTAAVTVLATAAVIVTVTVTVTVSVSVSATAVAATVPATDAVSVSVPGTAPCSYGFRHSFS